MTIKQIWNTMTPEQQKVAAYIINEVVKEVGVSHSGLYHHGILGMRWGVRNDKRSGGNKSTAKSIGTKLKNALSLDASRRIIGGSEGPRSLSETFGTARNIAAAGTILTLAAQVTSAVARANGNEVVDEIASGIGQGAVSGSLAAIGAVALNDHVARTIRDNSNRR